MFIAEEKFIPRNSIILPRLVRRDFKTDVIMCQVTDLCAICKHRSETHEFQMIRCSHPFHASCLQSLMASGRVHSCPTCRQRFRAKRVSPVYFNDPKCAEHCKGGQAEPSVAGDVIVEASSGATGAAGAKVGASTGARSRNPYKVIIANSSVLAPFNDDASVSTSMPSLESVDPDYTKASTTNLGRPTREVSSDDIA